MSERDPRIASRLHPADLELLRTLLGEGSPLLEFAEAVLVHLTWAPGEAPKPTGMVATVAEVLQTIGEEDSSAAVRLLCERPVVLASFFQNADLLDPQTSETEALARVMVQTLERLDERLS